MADDRHQDEARQERLTTPHREVEESGKSSGVTAAGQHEGVSYSPTGGSGLRHWQEATITQPGLEDRGDIYFAAVELTRMPMIITDPNLPDDPVVFVNRAFCDLTGYEKEEVVGRNCRFLQGPETDPQKVDEMRQAVREKRAVSVEVLNYKRDGTPFWNGVYIAPIFNPQGKLLYFFASQLDVTRRRTSEQYFRQAQKMESIGQLTAGLAHDFNNLLQVVAGNLEILGRKANDPSLRRYIDQAASAAERGTKLTKQLLAFARKTRLDPKVADINALINEFGDVLDSTVGGSVTLQFNLQRRLPPVMIDPVHLEMALLNVVLNARDAMPQGGTITVATSAVFLDGDAPAHHLPSGPYVVLTVADKGQGMSPEVLERVTEPFFTTKEAGKGTGLGLAMVHGFVQQSLGRLEIDSRPGQGTAVRMLLPVASREARPAGPPPETAPEPTAGPRGRGETVLIVEDSEDVLALAQDQLTSLGYRVLTARSADDALPVIEEHAGRIDLLFTDIIMPGSMNGLVLAERAKERLPGVPVLLTTGYNEDLVAQGPLATMMDVIGKPYRRSELADRVRAALDRKGGTARKPPPDIGPRHEA